MAIFDPEARKAAERIIMRGLRWLALAFALVVIAPTIVAIHFFGLDVGIFVTSAGLLVWLVGVLVLFFRTL